MTEKQLIWITLGAIAIAVICGVVVKDARQRIKLLGGAAGVYVLVSIVTAPALNEAFARFLFTYIMCFCVPFSFGASLAKRFTASDKNT